MVICSASFGQSQNEYDDDIYNRQKEQTPIKSVINNKKVSKDFNNTSLGPRIRIEPNDSTIIYIKVPSNLKVNDKIFLVNQSTYQILQAAVVLIDNGITVQLGRAMNVSPGCKYEMASFDNNWLKNIRGKTLGIKVKGQEDTNISSEAKTNQETTYDFNVTLLEDSHDLYIIVNSNSNTLDF